MLQREVWRMIREMIENGVSVSSIARGMSIDRKTVRKYASSDAVPAYSGRHKASRLDSFKDYIREVIDRYDLNSRRIFEEIKSRGTREATPYIRTSASCRGGTEGLFISRKRTHRMLAEESMLKETHFPGPELPEMGNLSSELPNRIQFTDLTYLDKTDFGPVSLMPTEDSCAREVVGHELMR